jgi:hypothetical protein
MHKKINIPPVLCSTDGRGCFYSVYKYFRVGGMTPESRVKAEVLKYLKLRQIKAWSNPSGAVRIRPGKFMSFGLKGSADILGCLPDGRFLAVEVKAPGGRLSPEQRQFLADIKALGGLAAVVRGWKELDQALREAGYSGITDGPLFGREH